MYESRLANAGRLSLGVLSYIGWITLLFGIVLYMVSGADGLGTVIISVTFTLTLLSVIVSFVGVIALTAQRIRKLGSVLTKSQLVIGRGLMTFGALASGVFALASVIADLVWRCEAGIFLLSQCVMCVGGMLCFACALPILRSFKKTS